MLNLFVMFPWLKKQRQEDKKPRCWPVLLLFLPRWALRTNENIIRILRENRRYFFNDDDIKHYIRNNELWQSFKRCTIAELLKIKGKYPHTFDSSERTSVTLSGASEEEDRDKRWIWNRWIGESALFTRFASLTYAYHYLMTLIK